MIVTPVLAHLTQPYQPSPIDVVGSACTSSHELIPPADGSRDDSRAIRAETRSNLLAALAKAGAYLDDLVAGRVLDIAQIAAREQRSVRSASMLLSLAFLAPDLVTAVVERRLPRGIGLTQMMNLPAAWADQYRALGLHPNLV
jgi:hypothetical protein